MIMLKHIQHPQITFSSWLSGCHSSDKAARQNIKLILWGSRAQLKQTLISIMVTLNFRISPSVILLVIIRCLQ